MDLLAQDSSAQGFVSFIGEKLCKTCGTVKHVTEFPVNRSLKYKGHRVNTCKPCRAAYMASYHSRRKVDRSAEDATQHYGVDEKFGETWKELDAALSMCRMTTPLAKAA